METLLDREVSSVDSDQSIVDRIRGGDADAWGDLIDRYESRLLAFAKSRVKYGGAADDIVQETFIGFLKGLESYDDDRSLKTFLFAICAHKITDHLRREGRRPVISLSELSAGDDAADSEWQVPSPEPDATTVFMDAEQRALDDLAFIEALAKQVSRWESLGETAKVRCADLLFVKRQPNNHVAAELGWREQKVADFKFQFIARTRKILSESSNIAN